MSGCADVCLDMGYDFDPSDFFREKPVTAKLRHHCCECGRVIEPGKRYERATGKCDGVFWSYATCADCIEIRRSFVCGSWVYEMLWETIQDEMFPIWDQKGPIDCLAKLESVTARDLCRTKYAAYLEARDA